MARFVIRGDSQWLPDEYGQFLSIEDGEVSWVPEEVANDFDSPQAGREALVKVALALLEDAKRERGRSTRGLGEFCPEWLATFVESDGTFDESGMRKSMCGNEISEPLSKKYDSRFYAKSEWGWVSGCDNGRSVGYELGETFETAFAFSSRTGALEACEGLEIEEYAIVEARVEFVGVESKGLSSDGEICALGADIEREALSKVSAAGSAEAGAGAMRI